MSITLKVFKHAAGTTEYSGEYVLEQDRVTIGRSKECTLSLEDPQRLLSRVHAELVRTEKGYRLNVLSKNYPVTVNGRSYEPGSEVMVRAGDSLLMEVYEIEIAGVTHPDPDATVVSAARLTRAPEVQRPAVRVAAPQATDPRVTQRAVQTVAEPLPPTRELAEVVVPAPQAGAGGSRAKLFAMGAAVLASALLIFLAWPMLTGGGADRDAEKRAEQEIARFEAQARSLLKLVERDRQEMKDAVAAANRETERISGLISASRAGPERQTLEAAHIEAIETARLNAKLERSLRESAEGSTGLPKAEGNLGAAAVAVKNGDRPEALKLLTETVGALTLIRSTYTNDRKIMLAEQQRRRAAFQTAESTSKAQAEARAKAESEARAKAQAAETARVKMAKAARQAREAEELAKANAEAQARAEADARARAEAETRARSESQARAKAEADARSRAEAQSRARALAEATARAETLARLQEQARARAEAAERAREAAAARERAAEEARANAATQRQAVDTILNVFGRIAR